MFMLVSKYYCYCLHLCSLPHTHSVTDTEKIFTSAESNYRTIQFWSVDLLTTFHGHSFNCGGFVRYGCSSAPAKNTDTLGSVGYLRSSRLQCCGCTSEFPYSCCWNSSYLSICHHNVTWVDNYVYNGASSIKICWVFFMNYLGKAKAERSQRKR